MENKKILYVHTGNHQVHTEFARTITDNEIEFSNNLPDNFDIYLFEGEYARPVFLKRLGKLKKDSKIIVLFADPRLYYLKNRIKFDKKRNEVKKMPLIKSFFSKMLLKRIDGAICEGKFNQDLLKEVSDKIPSRLVYPFIWESRYQDLIKLRPSLDNHNILFVGSGPDFYCKGLDELLKVFKKLKEEVPDARLYVLGENWNIKEKIDGVYFEGKKEVLPYLRRSSLLIHLGKGEGFGVNVLESLLAGVPAIVSEYTGAKEVVEKVDKTFIMSLNEDIIVNKIKDYFNMKSKDKLKLSAKGRKIAADFREKDKLNSFKNQFENLVEDLYGR